MWKTIIANLPGWEIFIQAFVVFIIPAIIAKFFKWIQTLEESR